MHVFTDWAPALPPAALSILALWVPGWVVTWALGLPQFRRFAFAPLASTGVLVLGGVAGPFVGLRWGWLLYLIAAAITVVVALFINVIFRRAGTYAQQWGNPNPQSGRGQQRNRGRRAFRPASDSRDSDVTQGQNGGVARGQRGQVDETSAPLAWLRARPHVKPSIWPAVGGLALTLPFSLAIFTKGMENPGYTSQTWDAMYHLSAVRWILKSGNGSTLNLNAVASNVIEEASSKGRFYPAGFHDLVSLTVTGDVIVATNAVVIVLAAILFPLSIGLMTSICFPQSKFLPILAAVLGTASTAFPDRAASYGVLWPTIYAYALIPLFVIVLLDWFGRTNAPMMSMQTTFMAALAAIGIAVVHPTGILVGILVVLVLSADFLLRVIAKTLRINVMQGIVFFALLFVMAAGVFVTSRTTMWQSVTNWTRDPAGSFQREAFGVIFDYQLSNLGHGDTNINIVLGVFTIIGALVAITIARTRWLFFTWALSCYLYVASAAVNVPGYVLVTPWYGDSARLGAIVPLFAGPLAGIGAWFVLHIILTAFKRLTSLSSISTLHMLQRVGGVGLVGVIIVGTYGLGYFESSSLIALNYKFENKSGLNALASPEELEFIKTLPQYVEDGERILADPMVGGTLIYAQTGIEVSFRHASGNWTESYRYVAKNFDKILEDPQVCAYLEADQMYYFYTDSLVYWPDSTVRPMYEGLEKARNITDAFKEVASGGGATLYEITPCPHVQAKHH